MKFKLPILFICLLILLVISACSPFNIRNPVDDSQANKDADNDSHGIIDNGNYNGDKKDIPVQRWSKNEFRHNEEDVLFFAPSSKDYMLTESYLNEQPDTGVIYTLTILRSFDEKGKVISQSQKYSFDIPHNAEYAYDIFIKDGNNYPVLVCVGYSIILEQTSDVISEQRTKAQFISDYNNDGSKFWLSMP